MASPLPPSLCFSFLLLFLPLSPLLLPFLCILLPHHTSYLLLSLIFTLQFYAHLLVYNMHTIPRFLHIMLLLCFLYLPPASFSTASLSLSVFVPSCFRHELITPVLPSLAVSRSLCLVLMTSVLGSVTVETELLRHRDGTNCMIESVCV